MTIITFDVPRQETFTLSLLLPWLPPGASIELQNAGDLDGSHVVRSSSYVIDTDTGDITLYVRLRL